jgi:hypothetical protein
VPLAAALPALLVWMVGCGGADPRETLVPDDPAAWETDAAFQKAWSELEQDEQARLDLFRNRYRPGGPMGDGGWVPGTSIRRALEEQVRFDAQLAQAQAQKEAAAEALEARLAALRAIIDLRLLDVEAKAAWREGEKSQLFARFRVENGSEQIVVAFKGRVTISQGARAIAEVPVLASEPVAGRSGIEWRYDFEVDPTSRSQQVLATTPVENLRVVWVPQRIDLADGTILTAD